MQSAGSAAPPSSASAASPEAAPLADEYEECRRIRREGAALAPADLADARAASGWIWPAVCGHVSGWAGIGIVMSGQAIAFAADGGRVLVCGAPMQPNDVCDVVDFRRGAFTPITRSPWPGGLDGTPVTQTPSIKALLARMKAPAPEGHFPYADDLRLSWLVGRDGGTLTFTLLSPATGVERAIQRFPRGTGTSEQPIVPQAAVLSPDGSVAALSVFTVQGGSGYDVALVNVRAEAAALFRAAAATTGDADGSWARKAAAADARAAKVRLPASAPRLWSGGAGN
jgi:hypothetical protein